MAGASSCVQAIDFISPAAKVIRNYDKNNAISDVLAGLTVGILILPQAMAYAQLAMLPPIYGLYTSVVPSIIYALIGSSHTMNLGTVALSGLLTGELIEEMLDDPYAQEADAINIALATAFLVGSVLLIVGLLRFGETLQSYMSPALISGFHSGATFHICVSQLRYILGTPKPEGLHGAGHIVRKIAFTFSKLGSANVAAIFVSVFSALILIVCQLITNGNIRFRWPFRRTKLPGEGYFIELHKKLTAIKLSIPIPGELIVVIVFEIMSYLLDFTNRWDVAIVGTIDSHMPPVRNLDWYIVGDLIQTYFVDVLVIAMITFSLTLSDAKMHSEEADRSMNPNREILALAITNMISPFFGSYISGAGISRSAIAVQVDYSGHITQLYSIISALVVLLAIPLITYVKLLPQAVLGTVVLMALRGVFIKHLKRAKLFWKFGRNTDFVVWAVTTLVTLFVDLDWGVVIGLLMTVNMVFRLLTTSKLTDLGRMPGSEEYIDLEKGGVEFPGVKIVKMESPLFFGSKDRFYEAITKHFNNVDDDLDGSDGGSNEKTHLLQSTSTRKPHTSSPSSSSSSPDKRYHTLVIDASALIFIDVAGIEKLLTISRFLKARGATLLIACPSDSVVNVLKQSDLQSMSAIPLVFETVGEAVLAGADTGIFGSNRAGSNRPRIARNNSLPHDEHNNFVEKPQRQLKFDRVSRTASTNNLNILESSASLQTEQEQQQQQHQQHHQEYEMESAL